MDKRALLICFLCLFGILSVFAQSKAPSHDGFSKLLKAHVSTTGKVDYKGFIKDSVSLNKYLNLLSKNPPNKKTWSENEQKAFWINAYNAFTIKLIIKNYPTKSIKDLGGSIYKVNTPWDIRFINIGDETYDLNNIEHAELRRPFGDPRIHFALVCAAKSCPRLLNEAFEAATLDKQLDGEARYFLSNTSKNKISANKIEISSLFKWYKGDFTNNGSLIDFLNKYAPVKISAKASISYLEYDWSLNE